MLFVYVFLTMGALVYGNSVSEDLQSRPIFDMETARIPRIEADDEPSTETIEDAKDPAFKTIATAALQKYRILKNTGDVGSVTEVTSVVSHKVTDLYKIYFDAVLGTQAIKCYAMNPSKVVMDTLKVTCS